MPPHTPLILSLPLTRPSLAIIISNAAPQIQLTPSPSREPSGCCTALQDHLFPAGIPLTFIEFAEGVSVIKCNLDIDVVCQLHSPAGIFRSLNLLDNRQCSALPPYNHLATHRTHWYHQHSLNLPLCADVASRLPLCADVASRFLFFWFLVSRPMPKHNSHSWTMYRPPHTHHTHTHI